MSKQNKPVVLIENSIVKQKWNGTKSLEMLQERFPNADLREDDAVCGQIHKGDGVYEDPAPVVDQEKLDREAFVRRQYKKLEDPDIEVRAKATKRLFKLMFAELADEED